MTKHTILGIMGLYLQDLTIKHNNMGQNNTIIDHNNNKITQTSVKYAQLKDKSAIK